MNPHYPRPWLRGQALKSFHRLLDKYDLGLVRRLPPGPPPSLEGLDWPRKGETMIGLKRMDNLQFCVEEVLKNGVPGDLIETGVWRGGATIFMRAILMAYEVKDRLVWVADSFQGLPKPNVELYPEDKDDPFYQYDHLRVSLEQVQANFQKYGLLDEQVRFLKGWFKDTLKDAPIERLAVLRLDGDMYESTMDALKHLYPRLSPGGFVIIDDYMLDNCRAAVTDFRAAQGITEEIVPIDWAGVYWKRTS